MSLQDHFAAVAALRASIAGRKALTDAYNMPCDYKPDMNKLKRMVEKTKFSPAYDAGQQRILEKFKARVAALPDLKEAAAQWPRMRRRDQTYFLERCATMLSVIQSESGFPVQPAAIRWRDDKAFRKYEGLATYNLQDPYGRQDCIEMRADCRSGSLNLAEALDVLVHEQTHIYQAWLARAWAFGRIAPDHPLYKDGELANLALTEGYIEPEQGDAYRAQCVEQDAWRAGKAAGDFMRAACRTLRRENAAPPLVAGIAVVGLALLVGRALARPGR